MSFVQTRLKRHSVLAPPLLGQMTFPAADGAALVAAAVQAAIHAGAPRRTVAAAAAAVAGIVMSAAARSSAPIPTTRPQDTPSAAQEDAGDPAQLLASLRAVRRARRQRKKQNKRAARQAANAQNPAIDGQRSAAADSVEGLQEGAAGPRAEPRGATAAVPAPAPPDPPRLSTPTLSRGLPLLQLPPVEAADASLSEVSIAPTMRTQGSQATSAGVQPRTLSSTAREHRDGGRPSPY